MTAILEYHLDLIVFVLLLAAALLVVVTRSSRLARGGTRHRLVFVGVLCTGAMGAALAYRSGETTRQNLAETVSGIAPTYAMELHEHGHQNVTLQTPSDDPTYLHLIATQKNWLKANPSVADIYTFMLTEDGQIALCVDSETDYNHNGKYDEDREQRTDIGEVYDGEDAAPAIRTAFSGKANFDSDINVDRWGTWVSANCPIRDEDGKVYAVVGVDFPAETWVSSILAARAAMLLIGLVTVGIILTAYTMMSKLRGEIVLRQEAELAARSSEARLRTIIANEPETVLLTDPTGVILEINPAGERAFGAPQHSLCGRSAHEFVTASDQQKFQDHLKRVAQGASDAMEFELKSANQTTAWIDLHSVPLHDADQRISKILCVGRDVTARRQAEREKEQLQQQLLVASRQAGMAEIATGVLHNVGNVLNSVNVSARLITDQLRSSRVASLGKLAELVASEKHRLGEFVTADARGKCLPDFLDQLHSKLRDDEQAMQKEVDQLVSGVEHIKEVVRMQQSSATTSNLITMNDPTVIMEDAVKINLVSLERHRVHITRDYQPDVPQLPLDKHKTLQILVNLISNAKKATCHPDIAERHLTLRVKRVNDGKALSFEVQDNGVGIAPDYLTRIFQHGFSAFKNGHGFGLHSGAVAAGEMRGNLEARSDGPGKGATFILTIPLEAVPTKAVAA